MLVNNDNMHLFPGAITISKKGEIGIDFSSNRMAWAYQKGNEIHYGIDHGQHVKENV